MCNLIAAPDGPPQEVQLEALSSQSIRVTWRVNSTIASYLDSFYMQIMMNAHIYIYMLDNLNHRTRIENFGFVGQSKLNVIIQLH